MNVAFALARRVRPLAGPFLGFVFAHFSFMLPVNRIYETDNLIAFYHPQPSYRVHILLVPKKGIESLTDLDEHDSQFFTDLVACMKELVEKLELEKSGYRLIANGGKYQDMPQLHFHLISE